MRWAASSSTRTTHGRCWRDRPRRSSRETKLARLRSWAEGLLDFVLYMQGDDGRFRNFVHDWDGTINEDGPTSYPGSTFWQARGVRALAKAHVLLRDERVAMPLARGF